MKLNSLLDRKTILKTMATLFLVGAAAVASQGVAYAHSLTITATASCGKKGPVINYTVTSWDTTDIGGSNPSIQVEFNGVVVDTEAFLLKTGNQFSGSAPAPPGTPVVDVVAFASADWADNYPSGELSNDVPVTLPTDCTSGIGRFTGGGKQVAVGVVTITKGFEVDCDLHSPSNNLEINWLGNQFHMETFTSAVCSLVGDPSPPPAPVNKIVGMGTGRYDGVDGYTVVFTLIDNGEPGAGNDEAGFLVYDPNGNLILNVPVTFVTAGNIQAHVDQQ